MAALVKHLDNAAGDALRFQLWNALVDNEGLALVLANPDRGEAISAFSVDMSLKCLGTEDRGAV